LYWFRTPPGVRVGRSAIDEDAIRLLEQHNPDVQFDWTHILKPNPQPVPAEGTRERGFEPAQGRAQRRTERRAFPRAGDAKATLAERSQEAVPVKAAKEAPRHRHDPAALVDERSDEPDVRNNPDTRDDADTLDIADAPDTPERNVETAVADEGFDGEDEPVVELGVEDRSSAAYQRLGSEGLARLRARYAEVMARIAERPMEDAAREELKLRAERLNPDGWVTTEDVQHALEQYESVFEGLRALVGTRRRRRRRRNQGGRKPSDTIPTSESDA
jgi:hypothetical protein